jgi:hypothetical protein
VDLDPRRHLGVALLSLGAISLGLAATAPTAGSIVDPTFSATPTTVVIGQSISVASITDCPAPDGAGDWTAIVKVAQGSNPEVSFEDFLVANDGSWSGTIAVPKGLTLGAATLTSKCFDAFHDVSDEVDYTPISITVVAPSTTTSSTASTTTTSGSSTSSTTVAVEPASAVPGAPAFTG